MIFFVWKSALFDTGFSAPCAGQTTALKRLRVDRMVIYTNIAGSLAFTEMKSIHLHDSIEGLSQKIVSITLHYITLHYITLHYITLHYITLQASNIPHSRRTSSFEDTSGTSWSTSTCPAACWSSFLGSGSGSTEKQPPTVLPSVSTQINVYIII